MARKPNYQLDRMERERAKAAKAAEKAAAKQRERDQTAGVENRSTAPETKA